MNIWSDDVTAFIAEHSRSAEHRAMFQIGGIHVKVCAMFGLTQETPVPGAARAVAALWLHGLASGNEDIYRECDSQAAAIYSAYVANRELH